MGTTIYIYTRCIYGIMGRGITQHLVKYGPGQSFTLDVRKFADCVIIHMLSLRPCSHSHHALTHTMVGRGLSGKVAPTGLRCTQSYVHNLPCRGLSLPFHNSHNVRHTDTHARFC